MNKETVLAHFTTAHEAAIARGDLDAAAKIEVLRAYFTDSEFREQVQDTLWFITKNKGA